MVQLTREQNSQYWTPDVLSQSMLGIWFAASHQPWMNLDFVLLELAQRPEWQAQLREEIGDHSQLDYQTLDQLPCLDSFIKETVRMNPLDNCSFPLTPLSFPFFFSLFSSANPDILRCNPPQSSPKLPLCQRRLAHQNRHRGLCLRHRHSSKQRRLPKPTQMGRKPLRENPVRCSGLQVLGCF